LLFNLVLSVAFKFASLVCVRLALEEYENLSSNTGYFLSSLLMSLAPNSLMAPTYAYDHVNCMPRNYLIKLSSAERIALSSLLLSLLPFCMYLILPKNFRKVNCCRRWFKSKRILNAPSDFEENPHANNGGHISRELTEKVMDFTLKYSLGVSCLFLLMMLLIHLC